MTHSNTKLDIRRHKRLSDALGAAYDIDQTGNATQGYPQEGKGGRVPSRFRTGNGHANIPLHFLNLQMSGMLQ